MSETERLVELWKDAKSRGDDVYLATLVHAQGSSYRKPGARMLVTSRGERAGTLSGGCLEGEISRKIRWFTRNGPVVKIYRSSFDDDSDGIPFKSGCGGRIWVLMETGAAVDSVMEAIRASLEERVPAVTVCSVSAGHVLSTRVMPLSDGETALSSSRSTNSDTPEVIYIPILPPPKLYIFGAGDDAQPLVRFASELGWHVCVADGRAPLLQRARFPEAKELIHLEYGAGNTLTRGLQLLTDGPLVEAGSRVVVMTHSYEQDAALLRELLPQTLEYLGVLGPAHRTAGLVDEIADEIGLSREECFSRMHSPVGLPIGTGDPAVIALSIVAEIQALAASANTRVERRVELQL